MDSVWCLLHKIKPLCPTELLSPRPPPSWQYLVGRGELFSFERCSAWPKRFMASVINGYVGCVDICCLGIYWVIEYYSRGWATNYQRRFNGDDILLAAVIHCHNFYALSTIWEGPRGLLFFTQMIWIPQIYFLNTWRSVTDLGSTFGSAFSALQSVLLLPTSCRTWINGSNIG